MHPNKIGNSHNTCYFPPYIFPYSKYSVYKYKDINVSYIVWVHVSIAMYGHETTCTMILVSKRVIEHVYVREAIFSHKKTMYMQ